MAIHNMEKWREYREKGFGKDFSNSSENTENSFAVIVGKIALDINRHFEVNFSDHPLTILLQKQQAMRDNPAALVNAAKVAPSEDDLLLYLRVGQQALPESEQEGEVRFSDILADYPGMPYLEMRDIVQDMRDRVDAYNQEHGSTEEDQEKARRELSYRIERERIKSLPRFKEMYPEVVEKFLEANAVNAKCSEKHFPFDASIQEIFAYYLTGEGALNYREFEEAMEESRVLQAVDDYIDVLRPEIEKDSPEYDAKRADILKAIHFDDPEIAFIIGCHEHRRTGDLDLFLDEQFVLHPQAEEPFWGQMSDEAFAGWVKEQLRNAGYSEEAAALASDLMGAVNKDGRQGVQDFVKQLKPAGHLSHTGRLDRSSGKITDGRV